MAKHTSVLIGVYGLIVVLISAVFQYNSDYFLKTFFPSKSEFPTHLKMPLIAGQLLLFAAALGLFVFRKTIVKKRKECLLLLITLVLMFIILEGGSRVYVCHFADTSTQAKILYPGQCGLQAKFQPHHYLNYHGQPNYVSLDGLNRHNSWGFRGDEIVMPKPAGVYRIVTIGGSTTYTEDVKDWTKDFARQLERELNERFQRTIEVINAGLGGWNSWESLINLNFNVVQLNPDMIIIYHGTNDVHTRLVNPAQYASDNSGRRTQWKKFDIPIMFQSTLFRLVTGLNPLGGLGPFIDTPTTAAGTKETGFVPQLNGTPLETLKANPPNYFERNLRNMIGIATEHDITVLLATWAHTDEYDDYAATEHYRIGFQQNNEVVKGLGKRSDVFFFDFQAAMPTNIEYWADGRHVNEAGAELKGKLFATYIYENPDLHLAIEEQE